MANVLCWVCVAVLTTCCVQVLRLVRELQAQARRAEQLHDYCIRRFESLLGERVTEFDRPSVDAGSVEFAKWCASRRNDAFNDNMTDSGHDGPGQHG